MRIKSELINPHTKEKENSLGIEWDFVRGFIIEHMNDDQGLDVFALAVNSMVIFPQVTRYIEIAVMDFF